MTTHEKVQTRDVSAGQVKALCEAVVQAVPQKLAPETAAWWTCDPRGDSNTGILVEEVKRLINRPPVLKFVVSRWEAFYHMLFGMRVSFNIHEQMEMQTAHGWIFVHPDLTYDKLIECCWRLWVDSAIISRKGSEFTDLSASGGETYRHESDRRYLLHIKPCPNDFVDSSSDAGKLTLKEVLIQVLFAYWSGDDLGWMWRHACGTRCGGYVPAIRLKNGRFEFQPFCRSGIKPCQMTHEIGILK